MKGFTTEWAGNPAKGKISKAFYRGGAEKDKNKNGFWCFMENQFEVFSASSR
jgi:hypothetical protein